MTDRTIGKVTEIWRYAVSSTGGQTLPDAPLLPTGILGDRTHAMVSTATQETVNPAQKQWQAAPQVLSRLESDGRIVLSLDGQEWLDSDSPDLAARLEAVFGTPIEIRPYDGASPKDQAKHRYELAPIHLVSRQALQALGRLLPDGTPDLRRFRPNIMVDLPNAAGPCPEYALIGREFTVGNVRLRGVRRAGRCSFTTLEQFGLPTDRRVLQALISDFERDFGIYCDVIGPAHLQVGDSVTLDQDHNADAPIIMVGAGQAAAEAALQLRTLGFAGQIKMFGDERHPPYERPPLSKTFITDKPAQLTTVLDPDRANGAGIDLNLQERVVRIDPQFKEIETQDGRRHPYSRLVIATGGTARSLPGLGRGHGRVHSIRTADDAERLGRMMEQARHVFVLGNGWLGLEIAATARSLGLEVTVFACQDHHCAKVLPKAVSDVLGQMHRDHGVRFITAPPSFTETADRVEAAVGGDVLSADLLVVTIGMVANDHLARHAGLDCAEGILTDENGATSDPDIFAIGDVSRQRSAAFPAGVRIESWHNASEQAARVARAILAQPQPAKALPQFWSDQYGQRLQIAGWPDPQATATLHDSNDDGQYWEFGSFAVAINQTKRIRAFTAAAQSGAETAHGDGADLTKPAFDPANTTRQRRSFPDVGHIGEGVLQRILDDDLGALVVTRIGGQAHAMQDRCPHSDAALSEGLVEGTRIICPLHFAEFDVRDGSVQNGPVGCPKARVYPITTDGDETFIWV